jgi:hypothetical protein
MHITDRETEKVLIWEYESSSADVWSMTTPDISIEHQVDQDDILSKDENDAEPMQNLICHYIDQH